MLKKTVAFTGLLFFALMLLLSALKAARAEGVSKPTRTFGLGEVRQIAVSPDQRFMATAGPAGVFLWDFQTTALLKSFETPWAVTAVAFSPDSKTLAGASLSTIFSWNTETGEPIRQYFGHKGGIDRLEFSPDGKTFVSAGADNTARIWSIESGEQTHFVRTPGSPIIIATFSPDGTKLATLDTFLTNCVKIWDIATETQFTAIPKTNWTAQGILFTADGHLLTLGSDRSLLLWDIDTLKKPREFLGLNSSTIFIDTIWTSSASTFAVAGNEGSVYFWDLETAELLGVEMDQPTGVVAGIPNSFSSVAFHVDYAIRLRDNSVGPLQRTFRGHTTSAHSGVAFSPDGQYVLQGGTESSVRLWNRKTGAAVRTFNGSPAGTAVAAFSQDGSKILTTLGLPDPGARLWNTESGAIEREFKWTGSWPSGAALSPDGTKVAASAQDLNLRIYNAATRELIRTIPNGGWSRAVAFSSKAPLLIAGSVNFTAALYNYETGQRLHNFEANFGPLATAAFSPNGDTFLIGWQDGLIQLFNTFTLELRREFFARGGFLNAAIYSPDGQYILTGEDWPFFTATLFDAQTAEPLHSFEGHKWGVGAVAFSANGASILTAAEIVREWDITELAARLRIGKTGLTWSLGKLQRAEKLEGPWTTLENATSPFNPSSNEPAAFFRVTVEAPAE